MLRFCGGLGHSRIFFRYSISNWLLKIFLWLRQKQLMLQNNAFTPTLQGDISEKVFAESVHDKNLSVSIKYINRHILLNVTLLTISYFHLQFHQQQCFLFLLAVQLICFKRTLFGLKRQDRNFFISKCALSILFRCTLSILA